MKVEHAYKNNKMLVFGILWSHCSPTLLNAFRASEEYDNMLRDKDLNLLWGEIKVYCRTGISIRVDPEERKREVRQCFEKLNSLQMRMRHSKIDIYLSVKHGNQLETAL